VTVADSLVSFNSELRTYLFNWTLGLLAAKPVCYISPPLSCFIMLLLKTCGVWIVL